MLKNMIDKIDVDALVSKLKQIRDNIALRKLWDKKKLEWKCNNSDVDVEDIKAVNDEIATEYMAERKCKINNRPCYLTPGMKWAEDNGIVKTKELSIRTLDDEYKNVRIKITDKAYNVMDKSIRKSEGKRQK